MANRLTMAEIQAILGLHERGWLQRRIARELDRDRETVAKYVRAASCIPKPAKAPIGSDAADGQATEGRGGPLSAGASGDEKGIETSQSPPGSEAPLGNSKPAKAPIGSESKPAKAPIGSETVFHDPDPAPASPDSVADVEASTAAVSSEKDCGRSACEPYRQVILEKLEQGLSAQRIYQDLVGEGFDHEYHSVRRFVARLRGTRPLPFRRMECEAAEEAQVDFGTGAWIELPTGGHRRAAVVGGGRTSFASC